MSEQITIIVSVPGRELSPNGRVHWAVRSKKKQAARYETLIRLREACATDLLWPGCRIDVQWFAKCHRGARIDDDNGFASLKAHRDALETHGLVLNDKSGKCGTFAAAVDRANPRVVMVLVRLEGV